MDIITRFTIPRIKPLNFINMSDRKSDIENIIKNGKVAKTSTSRKMYSIIERKENLIEPFSERKLCTSNKIKDINKRENSKNQVTKFFSKIIDKFELDGFSKEKNGEQKGNKLHYLNIQFHLFSKAEQDRMNKRISKSLKIGKLTLRRKNPNQLFQKISPNRKVNPFFETLSPRKINGIGKGVQLNMRRPGTCVSGKRRKQIRGRHIISIVIPDPNQSGKFSFAIPKK